MWACPYSAVSFIHKHVNAVICRCVQRCVQEHQAALLRVSDLAPRTCSAQESDDDAAAGAATQIYHSAEHSREWPAAGASADGAPGAADSRGCSGGSHGNHAVAHKGSAVLADPHGCQQRQQQQVTPVKGEAAACYPHMQGVGHSTARVAGGESGTPGQRLSQRELHQQRMQSRPQQQAPPEGESPVTAAVPSLPAPAARMLQGLTSEAPYLMPQIQAVVSDVHRQQAQQQAQQQHLAGGGALEAIEQPPLEQFYVSPEQASDGLSEMFCAECIPG